MYILTFGDYSLLHLDPQEVLYTEIRGEKSTLENKTFKVINIFLNGSKYDFYHRHLKKVT